MHHRTALRVPGCGDGALARLRYIKHMAGQKAGKTCIDCHKGIAHHLPKEYKDEDE